MKQLFRPQVWEAGYVAPQGGGKGGGGGGGQAAPTSTTSTVTQSNLPEYARPYFEQMMGQASSLAQQPYQAYTGDRIAPMNNNQNAAVSTIEQGQGAYKPYFNAAAGGMGSALNTAIGTSGAVNPQGIQNTYQANDFTPAQFTGANVQQYMNPYLQNALAPQVEMLNKQFGRQASALDSKAAANGAFGGYRHGIEQSQNTLNNNLALSNLVGQNYANAYGLAANQFNTSQQQNAQANALNNQNQQQQSQLGMQASGMQNQFGLQGQQLGLAAAQGLGGLGQAYQSANQNDANALMSVGTIQQNQAQTGLNTAYEDYLNQRYYPYQALNWESGIMRGVPVTANQQVTGYSAPPSPVSQVAGLGLGALGLSRIFG